MRSLNSRILFAIGPVLSLGVFVLMLLFTHAFLYVVPYAGFYFNPHDGGIVELYGEAASRNLLLEGDLLKSVGGVSMEDYQSNRTIMFFKGVQPGEIVEIVVLRNGEEISIPWILPGRTREEFMARFINGWWLGYIFWGFGLAVQLFMGPRDVRWRLLISINEGTGFWLLVGTMSARHIWYSSILLHSFTWILLPVYWSLHWLFPSPLGKVPAWLRLVFYLSCVGIAIAELFQILPGGFYFIGVLLMFGGSIALLFFHLRRPQERRSIQLLLLSMVIALLPSIGLSLSGLTGRIPESGMLGILALPFMPAAYVFIIFRQQLGGLELRANRIFSIYLYLVLIGTVLLMLLAPAALSSISTGALIILMIATALVTAYLSIAIFPAFQAFIDQRLLGIKLPYQNLPEIYSSRITSSASMPRLLKLLEEEVFPSLLVRQYAVLHRSGEAYDVLLAKGIDKDQLPDKDAINGLVAPSGRYLPSGPDTSHTWIRLILPLKLGEDVAGLWLLGRRDPDDTYHEVEIPILQSLADQTAVATSNLLQAERLSSLYQLDIDRREQERLHLALDLHDSVLNQLAVLRMNADEPNLSPNFEQAYEDVVQRLRGIVSDLRPPMLTYGLKLAVEGLIEDLAERSGKDAEITLEIQAGEERYPPKIELHLFRIVQEACENALRHAHASHIKICVQLDGRRIFISIEDDGVGFAMREQLELDDLLINKHFGLAGVVERARLIGAEASIHSMVGTGTQIQVVWNAPPPAPA